MVRRIIGMGHHRLGGNRGVSNRRTIERCTAHRHNSCRGLATKSQRRKGYDIHSSEPSQQQKQVNNPFHQKKERILKHGVEIHYKRILILVVYPIVMTGVVVWLSDDLQADLKERWDTVRAPPRKPKPQQHRRQVDGELQ
eukprot:scaffold56595_cov46-Attheya_sp.AAC.2